MSDNHKTCVMSNDAGVVRNPEIIAYRSFDLVSWCTDSSFTFKVEVYNCSPRELPSNSYLTLSGMSPDSCVMANLYHVGILQPGKKRLFTVRVTTPFSTVRTSEFLACHHPPKVFLTVQCDGTRRALLQITPPLQDFCRELKMSRPPSCGSQVFNILLMGSPGVGKSSFINSAFTLVSESSIVLHHVATVDGDGDIATTTFRRHVLAAESLRNTGSSLAFCAAVPEEEFHIALWDTWGMAENSPNYTAGAEFEAMLEGLLPIGWEMGKGGLTRSLLDRARATAASRKPHAIMLFMSPGEVDDENRMKLLSRNFAKAVAAGYTPMLVIGLLDRDVRCGSVRADPLLCDPSSRGARKALQGIKKQLSTRLQVLEGTVYYSVPYTTMERSRRYEIDALTRWNMNAALFSAKGFLNGGGGVGCGGGNLCK